MIEYIYFVKCPGCDDEHFDFFDAAKEFALGCLSQKPIITQTEVTRNDFGECTDHCDLGTVWSWEDMMEDTTTDAEPAVTIFTRDDLECMNRTGKPCCDAEFDNLDNSVDFEPEIPEVSAIDNVPDNFRKPDPKKAITEGECKDCQHDHVVLESSGSKIGFKKLGGQEDAWITEDDQYMITQNAFGRYRVSKYDPKQSSEIDTYEKIAFSPFFKTSNGAKHWINNTFYGGNSDNSKQPIPEGLDEDLKEWISSQGPYVIKVENNGDGCNYEGCGGRSLVPIDSNALSIFNSYDAAMKAKASYKNPNSVKIALLADEQKLVECRKPVPEGMTIEQLVEEMEENEDTVECTWCNDLFDKDQCRKEVDLGWLCGRCEAAIKSRGETLTFKENNYWDFLDETLDLDIDLSNCVDFSDMEIWGIEPTGENAYKAVLLKKYEDVPFQGTGYQDEINRIESEMFELGGLFVFHFGKDGLPILGRWDPELRHNLAGCDIYFADNRYEHAVVKAWSPVSRLEELEEAADYRNHLTLCPECGAEEGFDKETGICIECGFNFEGI